MFCIMVVMVFLPFAEISDSLYEHPDRVNFRFYSASQHPSLTRALSVVPGTSRHSDPL